MTTQDAARARIRRVAMLAAAQAGKFPAQIAGLRTQMKRDAAARHRAMLAGGQEEPAPEPAESATTNQTSADPAKARRRAMLGLRRLTDDQG